MRTSDTAWASDSRDAPGRGDLVADAEGCRWQVIHVGRLVWLRPAEHGNRHDPGTILLEPGPGFWTRYRSRQLALRFAAGALMAVLLVALGGCLTLTGIAVAPNGSVWLAGNVAYDGPAVYSCAPTRGELHCVRVPLVGTPATR